MALILLKYPTGTASYVADLFKYLEEDNDIIEMIHTYSGSRYTTNKNKVKRISFETFRQQEDFSVETKDETLKRIGIDPDEFLDALELAYNSRNLTNEELLKNHYKNNDMEKNDNEWLLVSKIGNTKDIYIANTNKFEAAQSGDFIDIWRITDEKHENCKINFLKKTTLLDQDEYYDIFNNTDYDAIGLSEIEFKEILTYARKLGDQPNLYKEKNKVFPIIETTKEKSQVKTKQNMKKSVFGGLNLEFGKFESDQIAFSFAGIAVKKSNGEYVVYDKVTKTLTEVGDMTMDMEFWKFPVQTLAPGDVTLMDGKILLVDEIKADGSIKCINPATGTTVNQLKRNNLFNMYFYTKIVSPFEMMGQFGGGNPGAPAGGMNPMMLMMMMGGDKEGGKGMFGGDMMQMMMMSQMMNGGQGTNPFAAMFGQPAVPQQ